MPVRPGTLMLSVDAGKMHKVDTRNVENLFGMWTGTLISLLTSPFPGSSPTNAARVVSPVFSKCAESLEDGRRLENLSWRIWNRETLCCETQPQFTALPAIDISAPRPDRKDVPELSASVASIASEEAESLVIPHQSQTAPLKIRSLPFRDPDGAHRRSRGKEKHLTSLALERMVFSIKEKQNLEPLSPTIADAVPNLSPTATSIHQPKSLSYHAPLPLSDSSSTAPLSNSDSDHSAAPMVGSDTSAETSACHSVVRGFSPSHVSSSFRHHTNLAPSPVPPKPIILTKPEDSRPGATFLLGGSSGEDDSSFDDHMSSQPRQSSLSAGLKSSKKQTSFKDIVESRTIDHKPLADEEVFESDDEDETPESAIEDDVDDEDDDEDDEDDGSDWEDSTSENGDTLENERNLFQRVESRPNLVSRRSLLTTLMAQSDRATAFATQASKSTPALHRSKTKSHMAPTTEPPQDEDAAVVTAGPKRSAAKPIIRTSSNLYPPLLSPRATRRNMLATELTESLRKNILWERQQKSTTAHAVLKRRHTAFDVVNLQDFPGHPTDQSSRDGSKNNSWNHYFDHGLGEYHQTGW